MNRLHHASQSGSRTARSITQMIAQVFQEIHSLLRSFNETTPFTKLMIIISVFFAFWGTHNPNLVEILTYDPCAVLYYREWYRIFTSQFTTTSLLQFLIILPIFVSECKRYETEWGPLLTATDFFWKNAVINITFMQFELHYFPKWYTKSWIIWKNNGLWPITLTYIFNQFWRQPFEHSPVYPGVKPKQNILYLIIICILNYALNRGIRLIDVNALLVEFIHVQLLDIYFNMIKGKLKPLSRSLMTVSPQAVSDAKKERYLEVEGHDREPDDSAVERI